VIYYHDFLTDVSQYAEKGKSNDFPDLDCCPNCRAKNRLSRHGFYERNAMEMEIVFRIPICRLRCPDCGKTVSIFPIFLLPYFQHTTDTIISILLEFWISCILLCTRQLRRFYEKRLFGKQTVIELFFRTEGVSEVFPEKGKEKAIKVLQMILAFGKATFVRRWWGHQIHSFMAAPLYHGARVVKTV
jgi:hypothetical protein